MKILYIRNHSIFNQDIEKAFLHLNCLLIYHLAPPDEDINNSAYLASFLAAVKENSPSFVFSPTFYPFISLACGALGLPYIAWLLEGYHPGYYSTSIRNEWNCIFTADSALYKDLRNLGVENIFFLPLGAPDFDNDAAAAVSEKQEYAADVSMIGTILSREDFIYNPISISSPLKDATKGYLEGCIACQHQLHGMQPVCSNLPSYIWNDLVSAYPPKLDSTLLTEQRYYEYTFFNHLITYADRERHLKCYTQEERYKRIHLYSKKTSFSCDGVKVCSQIDYHKTLPLIASQSIINLVITHRNDRTMISAPAWAIMAAKGFLLSNYQKDYNILDHCPVIYNTETELSSLSAYYYHHEEERKDLTEEIYKEVMKKHTYFHRIQELLSIIC